MEFGVPPALLSEEWIIPFQTWETGEIGVGGLQDQAALDGEGGKMGIGGQVTSCA